MAKVNGINPLIIILITVATIIIHLATEQYNRVYDPQIIWSTTCYCVGELQ